MNYVYGYVYVNTYLSFSLPYFNHILTLVLLLKPVFHFKCIVAKSRLTLCPSDQFCLCIHETMKYATFC